MFKYFKKSTYIDDIFNIINEDNNPKIILCDYNVLIDKNKILNEHTSMFNIFFQKFLKNEKLLEFIIYSKLNENTCKNMEDGFLVNNLLDNIYDQNIFNISFFKQNKKNIDSINNIIQIRNNVNQNDFLYKLSQDDFYIKPYNNPLNIYILFSSLSDVLDYILRYKIPKYTYIILYNTNFNFLYEYETKIIDFINNIIN